MEQFLDGPEVDVDATWQQWGHGESQQPREIFEIFGANLGMCGIWVYIGYGIPALGIS